MGDPRSSRKSSRKAAATTEKAKYSSTNKQCNRNHEHQENQRTKKIQTRKKIKQIFCLFLYIFFICFCHFGFVVCVVFWDFGQLKTFVSRKKHFVSRKKFPYPKKNYCIPKKFFVSPKKVFCIPKKSFLYPQKSFLHPKKHFVSPKKWAPLPTYGFLHKQISSMSCPKLLPFALHEELVEPRPFRCTQCWCPTN